MCPIITKILPLVKTISIHGSEVTSSLYPAVPKICHIALKSEYMTNIRNVRFLKLMQLSPDVNNPVDILLVEDFLINVFNNPLFLNSLDIITLTGFHLFAQCISKMHLLN